MDRDTARRYLDFATQVVPAGTETRMGPDESAQLEPKNEELLAALDRLVENGDVDGATTLASILWRFWIDKGHVREGRALATKVVLMKDAMRGRRFGEALYGAGMLAFRMDDNVEAERLFQSALSVSREQGDGGVQSLALTGLARTGLRAGDFSRVKRLSEEARKIARALADERLESRPLHMLAAATKMGGDLTQAKALYEQSLALSRRIGDKSMETTELDNLGSVMLRLGDVDMARNWYREAARMIYEQRTMYMLPYVPLHFGMVAVEEGNFERAVKLLGASESLFEASGMKPDPDESVERDRTLERVRKEVDRDRFARLWEEGRGLSVDETVRYSLER